MTIVTFEWPGDRSEMTGQIIPDDHEQAREGPYRALPAKTVR